MVDEVASVEEVARTALGLAVEVVAAKYESGRGDESYFSIGSGHLRY